MSWFWFFGGISRLKSRIWRLILRKYNFIRCIVIPLQVYIHQPNKKKRKKKSVFLRSGKLRTFLYQLSSKYARFIFYRVVINSKVTKHINIKMKSFIHQVITMLWPWVNNSSEYGNITMNKAEQVPVPMEFIF